MAEQQLKKIRALGKLEEIAAIAHHIDFFTNTGLSVHYKSSQASSASNFQHLIFTAVAEVLRSHPVLFAVPVFADTKQPYWARLPSIDLKQTVLFEERSQPLTDDGEGSDRELDALLEKQHNISFKDGYGTKPVWRLIILQDQGVQDGFTACLIAHHSMCDGSALHIFQNSFQKALCNASSSSSSASVPSNSQYIISSNDDDSIGLPLEELHPLPLPANPPNAISATSNVWTGSPVQLPLKTRYMSLSLAPHLIKPFMQECRKNRATPTAAIPSLIAKLLYDNLPPTTESLTCNLPVSLRADLPPKAVEGVLGNFIDAFRVQLNRSELYPQDSKSGEIWPHARKIQNDTRQYFANTSPSGEPYTNIALFKLIPDLSAVLNGMIGQPRAESFEVSNLGTFSQPAGLKGSVWQAGKVTLSRCAFAPGAALVVCVLNGDANIGFGFTWQEGVIDEEVVLSVVKGVREYFGSL